MLTAASQRLSRLRTTCRIPISTGQVPAWRTLEQQGWAWISSQAYSKSRNASEAGPSEPHRKSPNLRLSWTARGLTSWSAIWWSFRETAWPFRDNWSQLRALAWSLKACQTNPVCVACIPNISPCRGLLGIIETLWSLDHLPNRGLLLAGILLKSWVRFWSALRMSPLILIKPTRKLSSRATSCKSLWNWMSLDIVLLQIIIEAKVNPSLKNRDK
jgi:hypothetical protein